MDKLREKNEGESSKQKSNHHFYYLDFFIGQGLSSLLLIQSQETLYYHRHPQMERHTPMKFMAGDVKFVCFLCTARSQEKWKRRGINCLASFSIIREVAKPNYRIRCSFLSKGRVRAWAEGVDVTLIKYLPLGTRLQEWG